jgi:succinate-acetate transporter protein
MVNVMNPEALGVLGLVITVFVFGLEQIGIGTKGGDHTEIGKEVSYVAFWFGGVAQVFTAIYMYTFGFAGPKSIYVGTVFGLYGFFWLVASNHFRYGGDKKMLGNFCGAVGIMTVFLTVIAFKLGLVWPLGTVLALIIGLMVSLVIALHGIKPEMIKVAGLLNILIGIGGLFLFWSAVTHGLF